jgi:hypothetical protein
MQRIVKETIKGIRFAGICVHDTHSLDVSQIYARPVERGIRESSQVVLHERMQKEHLNLHQTRQKILDFLKEIDLGLKQTKELITGVSVENWEVFGRLVNTADCLVESIVD